MTEALLSQVIGVLLFVTVVVIVIIVVAEFSIKAGAKRKRESAERLRRIWEEERKREGLKSNGIMRVAGIVY